ncbi:hypothetical protein E3E31_07395 [Thermococcus sp. M39]|uniref:M48 family metallopeptidase n=1 Tax=Thermococcus sp. M39 TaxID=1638262 RepID=UPI00143A1248|nr:M48 family metallopeptidase [Thermococcus sp. M39]NJE08348.1 hypothetical protein [Thermococcus sp. M39]
MRGRRKMDSRLIPFLVISMVTVAVPALVMKIYADRILKSDLLKEEKMYRGVRMLILCMFMAVVIYFPPVIALGLLGKMMKLVDSHVSSISLGALLFAGILIGPVIISILVITLVASRVEVEVKGLGVKTSEIAKDILKVIVLLIAPGLIWFTIYIHLPGNIRNNSLADLGVFAVYILAFFALAPYWTRLFSKPRPLEEPLRSELLKFCESLGFKVRDIRVTGKKKYKIANAGITGIIPGYRYIFITEYMLETFDPEEIKAVIAHEIGHIKGRHLWINAMIAIGWFVFWMGVVFLLAKLNVDILSPAVFFGVFFSAYILYFVVIQGKISMRNEFKADEFAAKVVGKETVIKTLEKLAEVNLTPKKTGKWFSFLSLHPSIEERVKHLEEVEE